jgi:hypothetical protein
LRLAFLLAALAVAGPLPSARVVDAARLDVTIAWLRGEPVASPAIQQPTTAILSRVFAQGFNPHPDPVLSPSLLSYSLFQRPPPLPN